MTHLEGGPVLYISVWPLPQLGIRGRTQAVDDLVTGDNGLGALVDAFHAHSLEEERHGELEGELLNQGRIEERGDAGKYRLAQSSGSSGGGHGIPRRAPRIRTRSGVTSGEAVSAGGAGMKDRVDERPKDEKADPDSLMSEAYHFDSKPRGPAAYSPFPLRDSCAASPEERVLEEERPSNCPHGPVEEAPRTCSISQRASDIFPRCLFNALLLALLEMVKVESEASAARGGGRASEEDVYPPIL